jgi:hypothetical protein
MPDNERYVCYRAFIALTESSGNQVFMMSSTIFGKSLWLTTVMRDINFYRQSL